MKTFLIQSAFYSLLNLGSFSITVTQNNNISGMVLALSFAGHVCCAITFSPAINLKTKIRSSVSSVVLEKAAHAFIFPQSDCCISVYSGLNRKAISCLQLIQSAAARLLTNSISVSCYVTPIFASNLWEPLSFRFESNILLTML